MVQEALEGVWLVVEELEVRVARVVADDSILDSQRSLRKCISRPTDSS